MSKSTRNLFCVTITQDREKQSVAVHTFDPDATPEQKAAAAGKGRSQIDGGKKDTPGGKGELAVCRQKWL